MDLNAMHYRRIELRKRFIVGALVDWEESEYLDLTYRLEKACLAGTVARSRVDDFIPMDIEERKRKPVERLAVGGWIRESGDMVKALDAYANRRASLPRDKAIALLAAFDAAWPNADNLSAARHLINNA